MSDPEKSMAFQKNKTALASANLDQKVPILTLADCLDLMLTAELSLANWGNKIHCNWANFTNLSILSWHGANGAQINNPVTAADPAILLSVQNGAANACRSSGVKFIRVQLALDYANLNRSTPRQIQRCAGNITSNSPKIPLTSKTQLAMCIASPPSLVQQTCVRYQSMTSGMISLGQLTKMVLSTSLSQASILHPAGPIAQ